MSRDYEEWAIPLIIVLVPVVIVAMYVISIKKGITVTDRWWITQTSVKWNETDVSVVCLPDSDGNTNCTTSTTVTTHTRCRASKEGRELPLFYPGAPCNTWWGDYITHDEWFYVTYTDGDDRVKRARFKESLWPRLTPGQRRDVKINLLNIIVSVEGG
jgi:hypothetical protein